MWWKASMPSTSNPRTAVFSVKTIPGRLAITGPCTDSHSARTTGAAPRTTIVSGRQFERQELPIERVLA